MWVKLRGYIYLNPLMYCLSFFHTPDNKKWHDGKSRIPEKGNCEGRQFRFLPHFVLRGCDIASLPSNRLKSTKSSSREDAIENGVPG